MSKLIHVTGQNSAELYTVSVPNNLLGFCNYDFTSFMAKSSELCRRAMRTGEYPVEEVIQLRSSILQCHRYYEQNMRGIFDKIVIDSWIEYLCRENEIGTVTLWNKFMGCRNDFERAVFQRLSDYRCKRGINQWVNLLKMQDYTAKKLDFVFGGNVDGVNEAVSRVNCFDLMFSVAANEEGYSLAALGSTRVYKAGRLPNAPFVLSGAAKEVVRNILSDVSYTDAHEKSERAEGNLSDQEAMSAFALIKNHLPQNGDLVVSTVVKSLSKQPKTVYVPSNFKAMIDLEIDAMLDNGMFLRCCKRCNQYFVCDDNYNQMYCDKVSRDGRTCLEIMQTGMEVRREPLSTEEMNLLKEKSDGIYKEMTARVGEDITQRDMSEWFSHMTGIRNHVINGEATMADFDNFVEYSRAISFKKPEPAEEAEQKNDGKPEVKPYQFQRVDRKELERQGLLSAAGEDLTPPPTVKPVKKNTPPPAPARIIRSTAPVISEAEPVSVVIPNGEPQFAETTFHAAEQPVSVKSVVSAEPIKEAQDETKIYSSEEREDFVREYKPHYEEEQKKDVKKRIQEKIFEEFVMSMPKDEPEAKEHTEIEIPQSAAEEREEPEQVKTYTSKAAKVVSAYKTFSDPVEENAEEKAEDEEKTEQPAIDFSEILQGIERNDGFEDENIPVDADGVPLSHKTRHVMDAIMKPSKVSPSLGFARKAENNKNKK